jgi:septum formation protein
MIHPIIGPMRLVLASASPRRAELLRAAGFDFDTLAVDVNEAAHPGERPEDYVRRLAMEKSARAMEILSETNPPKGGSHVQGGSHVPALKVVSGFSRILVLGADTAVVIDGDILGKPRDDDDAASMLRRLSGRSHAVMTGVSLRGPRREASRVETTMVEFLPLGEADITWYVASGEGRDKAGAYAIQGLASRYIPSIRGSYSNVVGLPIAAVHELVAEIASSP